MAEAPFVGTSGGRDAIAATVLVSAVRSKLAAIAKLCRDRLMANPPLALYLVRNFSGLMVHSSGNFGSDLARGFVAVRLATELGTDTPAARATGCRTAARSP